jgi:hypothetical protein
MLHRREAQRYEIVYVNVTTKLEKSIVNEKLYIEDRRRYKIVCVIVTYRREAQI